MGVNHTCDEFVGVFKVDALLNESVKGPEKLKSQEKPSWGVDGPGYDKCLLEWLVDT